MAYCRECLSSISSEAVACPHCGVEHPVLVPPAPKRDAPIAPGESTPGGLAEAAAPVYCRECLGSISAQAVTCPHCGVSHPLAEPASPARTAPIPRVKSSKGRIGGGLLVLGGAAGLLLFAGISRNRRPNAAHARDSATTAAQPAGRPDSSAWYTGGSLHHATITQWRAAAYRNQLATAADFVAAGRGVRASETLPQAIELVTCIDRTVLYGKDVDAKPVAEIAALCVPMIK